jgi:hypothetical protein
MKAPTQLRTERGHLEDMKLSTFNSTPRKGRFSSLTQTNEAQENFNKKQIDLLTDTLPTYKLSTYKTYKLPTYKLPTDTIDLLPTYTIDLPPMYTITRFIDQKSYISRRSFEQMSQVYAVGQGGK